MKSISESLSEGRNCLSEKNIDPREARLLLAYSMGIPTDELIKYDTCSDEEYMIFKEAIKRRVQGEPYAYITGYKEFMKLKFKVNKYTLIPREDTETLVQKAIEIANNIHDSKSFIPTKKSKDKNIRILDMCTGSGCIAISLAKYIQGSKVDAVDISKEALLIAKENAEINNVKINFIYSNLFENVFEKYDLIVSNPPYISTDEIEKLQIEVRNEPHIALDGGIDGLDFYKKISKDAKQFLKPNGILIFEIGFLQAKDVKDILENEEYKNIEILKDLSDNDRIIISQRG